MAEYTSQNTIDILRRHILVDGFPLVVDFEKSRGCHIYDGQSGKKYFDFFSFFASNPIGFNHQRMDEPEFLKKLLKVARVKPTMSDMYTPDYAEFVDIFSKITGKNHFTKFFFIDGGALAVENALKASFDWKVRKNIANKKGEKGFQVIHFQQAFHGRSGYTMSLTNTDPNKIKYFPKFKWPRIVNPKLSFQLNDKVIEEVKKVERMALQQIHDAIEQNPDDIACLIIEPIQSEGGDNHFRGEFLRELRQICDKQEIILIFDEIQSGFGITGKFWSYEHFDVKPDIVCFGKKSQVCGIAASDRFDEVDSVFKVSGRINSTFGGNLTDMVRVTQYLKIIESENLVQNAAKVGEYILSKLTELSQSHPQMTNIRGKGLLIAFDLPSTEARDEYKKAAWNNGLLILSCGDRSIRLRPVLDIRNKDVDEAIGLFESTFKKLKF